MAKTLSAPAAPQTTAEYEAEFEVLMQEAARLNQLMAQDRVEIERLKAETKVIRDETRALSADMTSNRQVQKQRHDREIADLNQANSILRLENDRLRNKKTTACGTRKRPLAEQENDRLRNKRNK